MLLSVGSILIFEPSKEEIYLDAASRYPFGNGSFQYIFAEHVIEHIPWEAGVRMLRECYRILAKGGKIRVITPDLSRFVTLLNDQMDAEARQFLIAKSRVEAVPMTDVQSAYGRDEFKEAALLVFVVAYMRNVVLENVLSAFRLGYEVEIVARRALAPRSADCS